VYPIPILKVGMKDVFGKSGKWNELMDYFHLNVNGIIARVEEGMKLKK
jgi:transketolase